MQKLVNKEGFIDYGIYDEPVVDVNYKDYHLRTPMGLPIPGFLKRLKFNQFHFFGLMGPDLMVGMAVVDLGLLTNGFFYVYDRIQKKLIEVKKLSPPRKKIYIRCNPNRVESLFETGGMLISMQNERVSAEGKGLAFQADLNFGVANPLRICTRAGYRGWVYTEKTSPIQMEAQITIDGRVRDVSSPAYMGLMDWTGGYMRKYTFWNWGAIAATLADGRSFGMNLAAGVNETGFTENAFWVDSQRTKVDAVHFDFDGNDLYKPWRLTSRDGKIDLLFDPESERGEKIHAGLIASRFTQLMGTFTGKIITEEGEQVELSKCPGWAEDHYAKW